MCMCPCAIVHMCGCACTFTCILACVGYLIKIQFRERACACARMCARLSYRRCYWLVRAYVWVYACVEMRACLRAMGVRDGKLRVCLAFACVGVCDGKTSGAIYLATGGLDACLLLGHGGLVLGGEHLENNTNRPS